MPMLVSIDTEVLDASIKTLTKVFTSSSNLLAHVDVVNKNTIRLSALMKGTGVAIYVPCEVEKKSDHRRFSLEPGSFLAAVTGRKNLKLEITGSTLKVRSDTYTAELVTTSADQDPILPDEIKNGKAMKLPNTLVEFIRNKLSDIELKPILDAYNFMPVAVRVTDSGALMACYDNWHMAFTYSKEVTGDLTFCLPASSLSLLTKEFRGKSVRMNLTETTLYAFNDTFELALSLPQQDSQNTIAPENAFALADTIRKQKGISVKLSAEDVSAMATNIEAVYKKGEHVDFTVGKKECKVTIKSTHGKIATTLRCRSDQETEFRVGFGFLRDVIGKLTGSVLEAEVVPDKMIFFKRGDKRFMLALLGKDKKGD